MRKALVLAGLLLIVLLSGHARDVRDSLVQQLRGEAPEVLLYYEGDTIRRIWGVPFAFGASPVDTAVSFVNRYCALFTRGASQLRMTHTQDVMLGKFTAVYFQQELDGIPVDRGELTLLVRNEEGYPLVLASNAVRSITPIKTAPTISEEGALKMVASLRPDLQPDSKPELVIYPHEDRAHLAWAFSVDNHVLEKRERYRVFVDAHTGKVLEWRSEVYYLDIMGHLDGYVTPGLRPDYALNPPVLRPIPKLRVSIVGGASVFTNLNGTFTLPYSGTSAVTVQANLIGPAVQVANQAGTTLSLQQTVTPPGPANFLFNNPPSEFNTAQMNGLIQTQTVYDFIKPSTPAIRAWISRFRAM